MVETYLIDETKELIHEDIKQKKWQEIVKELGLKGQESLTQQEKSPVPFTWINNKIDRIFKSICGMETEVNKYDKTPIPLEILGLVKLAENEKYFPEGIFILYDDIKPDPICIGKRDKKKYLIGRWGDENRSFEELEKLAFESLVKERKQSIETNLQKLNNAKGLVEATCRDYLNVVSAYDSKPNISLFLN